MRTGTWILREPLRIFDTQEQPYLATAMGLLGGHELLLQYAPEPFELKVFLDGGEIWQPGLATVAGAWFKLCRELGYEPEAHWDLDPALILFRQTLPALARGWRETAAPFPEHGLPDEVVCLATVQAAWEAGIDVLFDKLKGVPAGRQVAGCFASLPLRAVVFHDNPGHRQDFVGTGVDEPLLGVYLHLGASRSRRATLAKATLVGTGGLRWSPWVAGGDWAEDGREFRSTLNPETFLWAAGQSGAAQADFAAGFPEAVRILMASVDPVVEAYRQTWPTGVVWHRDPLARYLNHMIVDVRMEDGRALLILDDGTDVAVAGLKSGSVCVP